MVYLCECCGAVSEHGGKELVRIDLPIPGVLEDGQCKKPVELCSTCMRILREKIMQYELQAANEMFAERQNPGENSDETTEETGGTEDE